MRQRKSRSALQTFCSPWRTCTISRAKIKSWPPWYSANLNTSTPSFQKIKSSAFFMEMGLSNRDFFTFLSKAPISAKFSKCLPTRLTNWKIQAFKFSGRSSRRQCPPHCRRWSLASSCRVKCPKNMCCRWCARTSKREKGPATRNARTWMWFSPM